jgi:hypothetical protein
MKDENLEQHLRNLPTPELPEAWRAEILAAARRAARLPSRPAWPPVLVLLRRLFAHNPITAGALTALWLLIFLFKASTPVDLSEQALVAHYDPNQPVYLVTIQDEMRLAPFIQDQAEPRPTQIP